MAKLPRRAFAVLVIAGVVGVSAGCAADAVMRATHFMCDYQFEGELGGWVCPDGMAYFLPLMAATGTGSGLVLVAYVVWELRHAQGVELCQLSRLATALGAMVLLVTGLALLGMTVPLRGAIPYFLVGVAGLEVRDSPDSVFYPVLLAGAVGCLASAPVMLLTAPAAVATALTWIGAVLIRHTAERRAALSGSI